MRPLRSRPSSSTACSRGAAEGRTLPNTTGAQVSGGDPTDPALLDAMRRSSVAWGEAAIASGTPRDQAEAAAGRTTAFYTGG